MPLCVFELKQHIFLSEFFEYYTLYGARFITMTSKELHFLNKFILSNYNY